MSSQGQNSGALKAGNTIVKGTTKGSGIGANIRYLVYKIAKKGDIIDSSLNKAERKHPNLKWIQILS